MTSTEITITTQRPGAAPLAADAWRALHPATSQSAYRDPRWLTVLRDGLKHEPIVIEAHRGGTLVGMLPLSLVNSLLFGRYLVSLPYVNWAGIVCESADVAQALIDRAVTLADELDVRHLELRHEAEVQHPALTQRMDTKANMRLKLTGSAQDVWQQLRSVVRTQIRKGQGQGFEVQWGSVELLGDFYEVFAQNMRDLGTPVYGRGLFRSILAQFPGEAELCIVRLAGLPVAAAVAVHGDGITEVPSASVERAYRSTAANSFMYWELIQRAIGRGQRVFDFGRSTIDSGTFAFKKKWGAEPEPAIWQYYRRKGEVSDIRPDGGKYDRLIQVWKRIPVSVTKIIGPPIVRGIP
jgi:FemAB-related protein (PEP-CTERM system-associated)